MMVPAKKLVGPLILTPIQTERIWGVTSLEPWFEVSGLEKPIGEAWLTSAECPIAAGSLRGETLGEAARALPDLLATSAAGGFPLLIKVLFPREKLSVQVHPNDAQAGAAGMPNGQGKTECWYVLSAEPGATVAVGFKESLTLDQVREAITGGTLEDKLEAVPVKAGDMIFVEAGTVHAIGPGVVILETQQYSDVTYRMFDYGRPRELHLEQGLAVTRVTTGATPVASVEVEGHTELVRSEYFVVDRFDISAKQSVALGHADELQILIALESGCTLIAGDGTSTVLPKAHAVVLPGEGVSYSVLCAHEAEVIRVRR
jgi:mannose-6-phosphate isomerase